MQPPFILKARAATEYSAKQKGWKALQIPLEFGANNSKKKQVSTFNVFQTYLPTQQMVQFVTKIIHTTRNGREKLCTL